MISVSQKSTIVYVSKNLYLKYFISIPCIHRFHFHTCWTKFRIFVKSLRKNAPIFVAEFRYKCNYE